MAKLPNRCRTQYPQSNGHPTIQFRLSPDLRYSTTSSSAGSRPARCALDRIGSCPRVNGVSTVGSMVAGCAVEVMWLAACWSAGGVRLVTPCDHRRYDGGSAQLG